AIPSSAHTVGSSQSHHCHGSQVSLPLLPAHQTRTAVRRQRNPILRSQVSRTADPIADQTGAKAWSSPGYSADSVNKGWGVSGEPVGGADHALWSCRLEYQACHRAAAGATARMPTNCHEQ